MQLEVAQSFEQFQLHGVQELSSEKSILDDIGSPTESRGSQELTPRGRAEDRELLWDTGPSAHTTYWQTNMHMHTILLHTIHHFFGIHGHAHNTIGHQTPHQNKQARAHKALGDH
jgi:hypothetical protein